MAMDNTTIQNIDLNSIMKPLTKKRESSVDLTSLDSNKVSKTSTGKRKFHNKSKTGCDNCKRRRVKCDETKPMCAKCCNMKLTCVYSPPQPRKRKSKAAKAAEAAEAAANNTNLSDIGKTANIKLPQGLGASLADVYTKLLASKTGSLENINDTGKLDQVNNDSLKKLLLQQQQQLQLQAQLLAQAANGSNNPNSSAFSPLNINTPGTSSMESLLLPPLVASNNKQSQPNGTASTFDKFPNFELSNSPGPQTNGMSFVNNLNGLLSPNKPGNKSQTNLQQLLQSQQLWQEPQSQAQNQTQNQLPFQFNVGTLSQLSKLGQLGQNLKAYLPLMNSAQSSGFDLNLGNIPIDFQELLGIKYNGATAAGNNSNINRNGRIAKANDAEEVLANMQHQQEQHQREIVRKMNNNTIRPDKIAKTSAAESNPTMSSLASMTPLMKSSLDTTLTDKNSSEDSIRSSSKGIEKPVSPSTSASHTSAHIQENNIARLETLSSESNLDLVDLRLLHHYCSVVWKTIISAGISGPDVWKTYIPELAFEYPFLMHTILGFSASHLSRTESSLEKYVSDHRLEALKLLRDAVLEISDENTDALVASALILIMDSLANASSSSDSNASAWIFHVKGAVTILTACWPLPETSRFSNLISVDLSHFSETLTQDSHKYTELACFDESISDLYPVEIDSPYLVTLAYLDQLHREKNQLDFLLRVFAFPALLDRTFLALLMTGDLGAMRVMRSYYKMLRGFTTEVKDKVWFLEGVSQVLPQDVDEYSGGGGMHMMLDFLGGGLPSMTTTNLSEFM
ncbi:hypothetical protein KAFR_0H01800 [Kazachstania africana CBS 2517]|uniref:Zn(2)-C6 fungal-type domain-containing protein n=1 Tax=Kazachstania africana (strain ATCC 22294 / BCRC 22015 / CBS 2517 / CECT 1963 / NBRC 1671 / NRRL Y-8276) TaxID=1071382 RepID=H2AZ34_KAZAF|nr:hypothetical protein KAFR_0H01800 [Kazachstania africana CBS 2517]CCF59590.1 hypothetical protein KAFR_0H01800 [Kazachstania africana CBS 2517]